MPATKKVIVVTGANKGIGRAIVDGLLENTTNTVIYLTARDTSRGTATLEELAPKAKSTSNTLKYAQLDVTDDNSVQNFAKTLKAAEGHVDVLVNNAGVFLDEFETVSGFENAKKTLDVNYFGVKRVVEALLELLQPGSRIITVASTLGVMTGVYPEERIQQLSNATTVAEVDAFVKQYLELVKSGKSIDAGFPPNAYRSSKSAVIAYSVVLSKLLANKNITVNAMCPGYVATDLNNHAGPRSVQQGADTVIYLATTPKVPFNGAFIYERKQKSWF